MTKRKSFFLVLPKSKEVLFASWKLYASEIEGDIADEIDDNINLVIEARSEENGGAVIIDGIPAHGMENNWHIFTKEAYSGKKIAFTLCCIDSSGQKIDLISSKSIDIPAAAPRASAGTKSNKENLYDLSRINPEGSSGSEKNSSW